MKHMPNKLAATELQMILDIYSLNYLIKSKIGYYSTINLLHNCIQTYTSMGILFPTWTLITLIHRFFYGKSESEYFGKIVKH